MPRKKKIEAETEGYDMEKNVVEESVDTHICARPGCGRDLRLTGYVENNGKRYCCPACAS